MEEFVLKKINQKFKNEIKPILSTFQTEPQTIAHELVSLIREFKNNALIPTPENLFPFLPVNCRELWNINDKKYKKIVNYYIVWEGLTKEDKKYIRNRREKT